MKNVLYIYIYIYIYIFDGATNFMIKYFDKLKELNNT
jgi:hypothetical protein